MDLYNLTNRNGLVAKITTSAATSPNSTCPTAEVTPRLEGVRADRRHGGGWGAVPRVPVERDPMRRWASRVCSATSSTSLRRCSMAVAMRAAISGGGVPVVGAHGAAALLAGAAGAQPQRPA